jgi:uncharacterized protein YdeI (YjbR/CyaY-like superfamily)
VSEIQQYYFKNDSEWREWLHQNHEQEGGIYLIFYKLEHKNDSMRWEEAVRVAICYGWIDSTVKSLGNGKRRQYFCQRNSKSVWSKVNKDYIKDLTKKKLMHKSGLKAIKTAKENGSWTALDDVENGVIPADLKQIFDKKPKAYENYKSFTKGQRKSFLYWLNQAKREKTRQKRIIEIIKHCEANMKHRNGTVR